jgi:hypothetical protein
MPKYFFLFTLSLIFFYHSDIQAQQRRSSQQSQWSHDPEQQAFLIGLAPLSLFTRTGRINLRGEYAYRPNMSVSVLLGVPRKTDSPDWLVDALTFKDVEGRVNENSYKSFVFNAGHRFYFGGKKPAGGFYLEPYVRYNRFTMTHVQTNEGSTGDTRITGRIGGPGIGGAMGLQWRIGQHASLDFTMLGADVRVLGGSLKYSSTDPNNDLVAFRDKVEKTVKDIPIIGNALSATLDDNAVRVRIPGAPVPGFRCNLTLAFAF